MQLPPLVNGRILQRYKRFLADVELEEGRRVTAHVPNTGRMTGCWAPGAPVQLSYSDNPRRKLAWTLERVDMGAGWIGVNTHRVNQVVAEGITEGKVPGLTGYRRLYREVTPGELPGSSRLDLMLDEGPDEPVFVEVKNVTLLIGDALCFPDAVTVRGRRHLLELAALRTLGYRAVILFALNRPEGSCFRAAAEIDSRYAGTLKEVAGKGVEVIALRLRHTPAGIETAGLVPVVWKSTEAGEETA
jgi:sugar fermentation stimulation protein A